MNVMQILKYITIKQQLISLCVVSVAALLLIICSTIYQLVNIKNELIGVAEEDIPLTELVTHIALKQLEQSIEFERALHYGFQLYSDLSTKDTLKKYTLAKQHFNQLSEIANQTFAEAEALVENIKNYSTHQINIDSFQYFDQQLKTLDKEHLSFEENIQQLFIKIDNNDLANLTKIIESIEVQETKLNKAVESLLKELEAFTAAASYRAEKHEESAISQLIIIGSISTFIISLLGFYIYRTVTNNITHTRNVIGSVVENLDFTLRLNDTGRSEMSDLGKDLNNLFVTLTKCFNGVLSSSTLLSAAAEELSTISTQNTIAVSQQYSDTDQVATAIEELSCASVNVSKLTVNAFEKVSQADKAIEDSVSIVNDNLSGMQELERNVSQASDVILNLHTHSTDISAALDTIQSVAEQTNLLALNAAIEAARAGDAGRGFAVVSDEVRDLATRTQNLTDQIRELIANLQSGSSSAMQIMEQSKAQTDNMLKKAQTTGGSLSKIADAMAAITEFNYQISCATEEQSAVATEISQNVASIRNVAQENSDSTKQTTIASEEVANLAANLHESSSQFKVS